MENHIDEMNQWRYWIVCSGSTGIVLLVVLEYSRRSTFFFCFANVELFLTLLGSTCVSTRALRWCAPYYCALLLYDFLPSVRTCRYVPELVHAGMKENYCISLWYLTQSATYKLGSAVFRRGAFSIFAIFVLDWCFGKIIAATFGIVPYIQTFSGTYFLLAASSSLSTINLTTSSYIIYDLDKSQILKETVMNQSHSGIRHGTSRSR